MKEILIAFLTTVAGLAAVPAQADTLLHSADFDNPDFVAPGVVVGSTPDAAEAASIGAWNAAGWSGNYIVNRSTGDPANLSFVTLSGLAPGSAVRIGSGIIGFLESWDSSDGGCCAPDFLDFFINGALVATMTTNNALGSVKAYSGATELFYGQQVNSNGYYSDTLIDLTTATFANSFADGSGAWAFGIQARGAGWQGGSDEGWGLDNISFFGTVASNGAVPEPATWAMMIAGFGVVGGAMRRRRARPGLSKDLFEQASKSLA